MSAVPGNRFAEREGVTGRGTELGKQLDTIVRVVAGELGWRPWSLRVEARGVAEVFLEAPTEPELLFRRGQRAARRSVLLLRAATFPLAMVPRHARQPTSLRDSARQERHPHAREQRHQIGIGHDTRCADLDVDPVRLPAALPHPRATRASST